MVILFLFVEPVFPIIILRGKDRESEQDDREVYVMHVAVSEYRIDQSNFTFVNQNLIREINDLRSRFSEARMQESSKSAIFYLHIF